MIKSWRSLFNILILIYKWSFGYITFKRWCKNWNTKFFWTCGLYRHYFTNIQKNISSKTVPHSSFLNHNFIVSWFRIRGRQFFYVAYLLNNRFVLIFNQKEFNQHPVCKLIVIVNAVLLHFLLYNLVLPRIMSRFLTVICFLLNKENKLVNYTETATVRGLYAEQ